MKRFLYLLTIVIIVAAFGYWFTTSFPAQSEQIASAVGDSLATLDISAPRSATFYQHAFATTMFFLALVLLTTATTYWHISRALLTTIKLNNKEVDSAKRILQALGVSSGHVNTLLSWVETDPAVSVSAFENNLMKLQQGFEEAWQRYGGSLPELQEKASYADTELGNLVDRVTQFSDFQHYVTELENQASTLETELEEIEIDESQLQELQSSFSTVKKRLETLEEQQPAISLLADQFKKIEERVQSLTSGNNPITNVLEKCTYTANELESELDGIDDSCDWGEVDQLPDKLRDFERRVAEFEEKNPQILAAEDLAFSLRKKLETIDGDARSDMRKVFDSLEQEIEIINEKLASLKEVEDSASSLSIKRPSA